MIALLKNPFVGWLLIVGIVVLALRFVPAGWFETADQKRVADISAKTESMMPSDMGYAIGQAAVSAASCGLEFRRDGAEIVLATSNFEYRFVEPGGVLEGVYNDGYQSARVNGGGSPAYCADALAKFGPQGTVLPTLLAER
jgi:hypothetical protein